MSHISDQLSDCRSDQVSVYTPIRVSAAIRPQAGATRLINMVLVPIDPLNLVIAPVRLTLLRDVLVEGLLRGIIAVGGREHVRLAVDEVLGVAVHLEQVRQLRVEVEDVAVGAQARRDVRHDLVPRRLVHVLLPDDDYGDAAAETVRVQRLVDFLAHRALAHVDVGALVGRGRILALGELCG